MGATYKLKRKKADGTLEDVALTGSLPFIPSNAFTVVAGDSSTYLSIKWAVANVDGITTPTDGMSLALRIPAVGGIGILLSIDGGNKYYPIVRNVNNILSSQYARGCTLILTFNASQTAIAYFTAGTATTVTGCWQIADYDVDSQVRYYHTTANANYPLLFQYNSGLTSTTTYNTGYTRKANNIYVNPAKGTIYANDFVVGGKSIVGGNSPFTTIEETYYIATGDEFTLEVPATDYMPLFVEIYVSQDTGPDYPPILQLYNSDAGDRIEIPYTYGSTYSIIAKPNGSNFDIYIRKSDGTISYLDSMCMEYIYLNSPYSQGWSYDTEFTTKICCINTMV